MTAPVDRQANFDLIARPYRWLEYASFGRALERCRLHFLPEMLDKRRALVLGDGDGRFLKCLLASNQTLQADAVDTSAAMLSLLKRRCATIPGASRRLRTYQENVLAFAEQMLLSGAPPYDLVVTHFLLDCLAQEEVEMLIKSVKPFLLPDAIWVVSEFRVPNGVLRTPAMILVRALYLSFRLLTGLRTNRLPNHEEALRSAGLMRKHNDLSLIGLLTTELWAVDRDERTPCRSPDLQCE